MPDWENTTAEEIRANGIKIAVFKISESVYEVYNFAGHIIQIHQNDNDIVAVIKNGAVVWMHPRTKAGLEMLSI